MEAGLSAFCGRCDTEAAAGGGRALLLLAALLLLLARRGCLGLPRPRLLASADFFACFTC